MRTSVVLAWRIGQVGQAEQHCEDIWIVSALAQNVLWNNRCLKLSEAKVMTKPLREQEPGINRVAPSRCVPVQAVFDPMGVSRQRLYMEPSSEPTGAEPSEVVAAGSSITWDMLLHLYVLRFGADDLELCGN